VLNSVGPTLTVKFRNAVELKKNVSCTFKISFHFLTTVFCVTVLYKNNETLEMRAETKMQLQNARKCTFSAAFFNQAFSTFAFQAAHFSRFRIFSLTKGELEFVVLDWL